jgi:hypothetical protein
MGLKIIWKHGKLLLMTKDAAEGFHTKNTKRQRDLVQGRHLLYNNNFFRDKKEFAKSCLPTLLRRHCNEGGPFVVLIFKNRA